MRMLLTLTLVAVLGGGHGGHGKVMVKTVSQRDVVEKLEGKAARVTVVEVTIEPGGASAPHRHPGPVYGYVCWRANTSGA